MTHSANTDDDTAAIRAQLQAIATQFNAVIAAGKKRALREAAGEAHRVVSDALQKLRAAAHPDPALIDEAEGLLMDIRWGQATKRFV